MTQKHYAKAIAPWSFLAIITLICGSCSTVTGKNNQGMPISPCANPSSREQIYNQVSMNHNANLFLDCARDSRMDKEAITIVSRLD